MSITNKLLDIVERVVTQLEYIKGGTDYNFTLKTRDIEIGYREVGEPKSYPFVCIASISMISSEQADQITYNIPIKVELFAYVNKIKGALKEAMKLCNDIEKAITTDETLDGNVWNLSYTFEASSFREHGVGVITLDAMTEYCKPIT